MKYIPVNQPLDQPILDLLQAQCLFMSRCIPTARSLLTKRRNHLLRWYQPDTSSLIMAVARALATPKVTTKDIHPYPGILLLIYHRLVCHNMATLQFQILCSIMIPKYNHLRMHQLLKDSLGHRTLLQGLDVHHCLVCPASRTSHHRSIMTNGGTHGIQRLHLIHLWVTNLSQALFMTLDPPHHSQIHPPICQRET